MSKEENKKVVRRYIEEAVNTGNVDNLEELISPDYTETLDPTGKKLGVEGAQQHILAVRKTFPELFLTIERQISVVGIAKLAKKPVHSPPRCALHGYPLACSSETGSNPMDGPTPTML